MFLSENNGKRIIAALFGVLILILMDVPFGETQADLLARHFGCLNPYSNGCSFRRH